MGCEKILAEVGEFCNQINIYFTRRMWYSGQVLCRPDLAFEACPAAASAAGDDLEADYETTIP